MSAKVLVELLLLVVGLEVGMLSESSYSVLLMLALASAVLTNPLISLLSKCSGRNAVVDKAPSRRGV